MPSSVDSKPICSLRKLAISGPASPCFRLITRLVVIMDITWNGNRIRSRYASIIYSYNLTAYHVCVGTNHRDSLQSSRRRVSNNCGRMQCWCRFCCCAFWRPTCPQPAYHWNTAYIGPIHLDGNFPSLNNLITLSFLCRVTQTPVQITRHLRVSFLLLIAMREDACGVRPAVDEDTAVARSSITRESCSASMLRMSWQRNSPKSLVKARWLSFLMKWMLLSLFSQLSCQLTTWRPSIIKIVSSVVRFAPGSLWINLIRCFVLCSMALFWSRNSFKSFKIRCVGFLLPSNLIE